MPLSVLIIGLDSMSPELLRTYYKHKMPVLNSLCATGSFKFLCSTDPPITVPAWVSMTTGKDPGELGLYGFSKVSHNFVETSTVSSEDVKFPRIWDLAEVSGKKSVVVSVPLTYPAKSYKNTYMTTCFLTPHGHKRWASRPSLARQLESLFGPYMVDILNFRKKKDDLVLEECKKLTSQHFSIFRFLIKEKDPDFAMLVDMGPDRFHHSMLRKIHPRHPSFEFSQEAANYYSYLDSEIEKTLKLVDSNTLVLIVSDHGIQPLKGALCINEVLYKAGLLHLNDFYPTQPMPLSALKIDMEKTKAIGKGGYCGRIYLNCDNSSKKALIKDIKNIFSQIDNFCENKVEIKLFEPKQLYNIKNGFPPDLTIYVNDLIFRCAATLGHNTSWILSNDTGFDDANHSMKGIFISNKDVSGDTSINITDIFYLTLKYLGISVKK